MTFFERFASPSKKTVSTSSLKILQKAETCPFHKLKTFVFALTIAAKPFSEKLLWPNFDLNSFKWFASPYKKKVSTSSLKNLQKTKKRTFQTFRKFIIESKVASNHFLRSFLWPNFDLNSFEHFASLSQKTVSISSIKNLQIN